MRHFNFKILLAVAGLLGVSCGPQDRDGRLLSEALNERKKLGILINIYATSLGSAPFVPALGEVDMAALWQNFIKESSTIGFSRDNMGRDWRKYGGFKFSEESDWRISVISNATNELKVNIQYVIKLHGFDGAKLNSELGVLTNSVQYILQ